MVLKPLPCTAYFFFTPRVVSTCDLENGQGDLQPIHHLLDNKEVLSKLHALLGLVHRPAPTAVGILEMPTRRSSPGATRELWS